MPHRWIADRMSSFDSSGIRKVFDLAAKMKNPCNLSIGQPDFDVPQPVRAAAIKAIEGRKNSYSLTQGIPTLRDKLQGLIDAEFHHADREVFVTSGTSGALVLAMMALVNPGDEVLCFDPYFVMYPALIAVVGGKCVPVDTYPDFRIDLDKVRAAITPKTKVILLNSPANPTGALAGEEEVKGLAKLAAEKGIALISDEIYRLFQYEGSFYSPAKYNPETIVIDGFSKSYGMTGWRVGYCHGPKEIIREMLKLQQYTFVNAPTPFQWAGVTALDVDMSREIDVYRKKRDAIVSGLAGNFEMAKPGGAFYAFPKVPWGTATQFVERAIENELLIIPGNIFSKRDTHFRLSYAASDETIARGIEILNRVAKLGK